MTLVLPDCEAELQNIMGTLVNNILTEYDISKRLIEHTLTEFMEDATFLYDQLKRFILPVLDAINCDEDQTCGHIITQHSNLYIETCGIHHYVHSEQDHEFVKKSDVIVKQHIIGKSYNLYINRIYKRLWCIFIHHLMKDSVPISSFDRPLGGSDPSGRSGGSDLNFRVLYPNVQCYTKTFFTS